MKGLQRMVIAAGGSAALVGVVAVTAYGFGPRSAAAVVGVVGSVAGLIGGWFAWARRPPTRGEIEAVGAGLREEALKRSVGALPALVSRQGVLELGVEPRLSLVHDPRHQADATDVGDIESAFEAAGRRLLIVGEPASGKTVAAYRLAGVVADEAEHDRVPFVVNLSAWADQESFEDFLLDYLCDTGAGYGIASRRVAGAWLEARRFALILDGLDEVPDAWRADLLARLNDWLPVRMPVVLTSRTREYTSLVEGRRRPVGLVMAVELQPLDDGQLDTAFAAMSARGDVAWGDLVGRWKSGQRYAVREALRSPLIVNLVAASHVKEASLREAGKSGIPAVREYVIDEYVKHAVNSDRALERWAEWIAAFLVGRQQGPYAEATTASPTSGGIGWKISGRSRPTASRQGRTVERRIDQTVFELSRLTPNRPAWYPALSGAALLIALILLPAGFIYFLLALPAIIWPLRNAEPTSWQLRSFRRQWKKALIRAALFAFAAVAAVAIFFGFLSWFVRMEGYDWRMEAALITVAFGFPVGVLLGLWQLLRPQRQSVGGALDAPWRQSRRAAVVVGFSFWLACVVGFAASFALATALDPVFESGVLEGARTGAITGLIVGALIGVFAALNGGGYFLFFQWRAWRRLRREHGLDSRPLAVLRRGTSARHGTLPLFRSVGSGVRFIHNDVRDRLATVANPGHETAGELVDA